MAQTGSLRHNQTKYTISTTETLFMTVKPDQFKQAMSQYAAGVTVVTTLHDKTPIGTTVNAFASVSADPPLILINMNKRSFTHKCIMKSQHFGVNVLRADQSEWGMIFAGMRPEIDDRFAEIETHVATTGSLLLSDSLAWLDCRVWAAYDGGDHTIIVGEVLDLSVAGNGDPLVYHGRQWRTTADLG